MPKRVGHLYEQMLDKNFIRETIILAADHKHKRFDVKPVLADLETYVQKTYDLLATYSYEPTKPKSREIWDPSSEKVRVIKIVPFWPDGVIQWLMVRVMQPVMLRSMYPWSCASIPGRGGKRVAEFTKRILNEDPVNTEFAAELDIYHFYPSVKVKLLMIEVTRKIKDKKFLRLIHMILISSCDENETGIAIGFYICQWLANFFLESLDWFIQTIKGIAYHTRYMDNIILYSKSKEALHYAIFLIQAFIQARLELTLKHTWQVFRTASRKIAAVGYRFARGLTILRKRNLLRILRQCRRVHKKLRNHRKISPALASGLISRLGQLRHCCSKTIYEKYMSPRQYQILVEVVSDESKRKQPPAKRVLSGRAA